MHQKYNSILERFFHTEKITEYSLDKIRNACEYFGNPQNSFKSIHIAGTNGKGSVSKMIFQMIKESGKRVGVYTSPHLIDIRERFEVANCNIIQNMDCFVPRNDGNLISEEDFARLASMTIDIHPELSYYEKCVILAFLYFRECGCEYAVIEVGMGGRLDATNIITPILSVITSISYDHMEYLGDTLEEIAYEKGGIIKPEIPVILYEKNPVLESLAADRRSPVIFGQERHVETNLLGHHQISNARIAYEAGMYLGIPESQIRSALLHVDHPGRMQYLLPNLLIDGAHNEDGMRNLRHSLESLDLSERELILCFNIKKGKSPSLVTDTFPMRKSWIIVDSTHEMVECAGCISKKLREGGHMADILSPREIVAQAEQSSENFFVIFGSLYMIGEFL